MEWAACELMRGRIQASPQNDLSLHHPKQAGHAPTGMHPRLSGHYVGPLQPTEKYAAAVVPSPAILSILEACGSWFRQRMPKESGTGPHCPLIDTSPNPCYLLPQCPILFQVGPQSCLQPHSVARHNFFEQSARDDPFYVSISPFKGAMQNDKTSNEPT